MYKYDQIKKRSSPTHSQPEILVIAKDTHLNEKDYESDLHIAQIQNDYGLKACITFDDHHFLVL